MWHISRLMDRFLSVIWFSGSTGFGSLSIFVPPSISYFTNFWLFGLFIVFPFPMVGLWNCNFGILYTLFTLVLLRHLGEYFRIVVFLYIVYHLFFLNKNGEYLYFWTGNVFLNRKSDFYLRMAKGGVCWFFIGYILLIKSQSCNVFALTGMLYISESSDI